MNLTPAMTIGNWLSPFSLRQVLAALMTSLKTMRRAVLRDRFPLVPTVRCRTVAKTRSSLRQALTERSLTWAVGIPFKQKVYAADVAMIFPVAGRGRPRRRHIPDVKSMTAQAMLEKAQRRTVSWCRGTKGRLSARFAAIRVRVADGPPQRIRDMGAQHLPGEEVWVIGEPRSTDERKYYLSNLPADTPLKQIAGAIKANRRISSSRRNLASTISRGAHGRACTGTR